VRIEALQKYRQRASIDQLPEPLRTRAWEWYSYFLMRRRAEGKPTPQTTHAILQGVAKRLAKTTSEERSAWGRSMLGRLGGLRVQQMHREQGRFGPLHPALRAAKVSVQRRRERKVKPELEYQRRILEPPPKTRSKWLDIF
jgi:hypothetical protein